MFVQRPAALPSVSPPRSAVRLSTDRGQFAYWQIAPNVYATSVQGHMTREMSNLLIERADPLYAGVGLLTGIHDWLLMTGYESACRTELTAWILRNKPKSALHIGVTLPIVAMGVTVANLALGNMIHMHANKRSLEQALHESLLPR